MFAVFLVVDDQPSRERMKMLCARFEVVYAVDGRDGV